MSKFRFGRTSRRRLGGVDGRLVDCCERALALTSVDFSVIEGLRSAERQAKLREAGASHVRVSMHQSGKAVDLAPYIAGRVQWEYYPQMQVAEAMSLAAADMGIKLRWGGCWRFIHKGHTALGLDFMIREYIARRRRQRRRPFVDAWHFEIR